AQVNVEPRLDFAAAFGNFSSNPEHVITNIDVISDRSLVAIFRDKVAVEETERLLAGRRRQTNEETIEVFQHLPPQVVDRTMAFISNDEIEVLNRNRGIVNDFFWWRICRSAVELRMLFE